MLQGKGAEETGPPTADRPRDDGRRFSGRVAVVTGAGTGIGAATAELFAAAGARVTVAGRSERHGAETVERIVSSGGEAMFVPTDVRREADVQGCVETTIRVFGRVDYLFNNAGVHHFGTVETLAETEWDDMVDTILKGTFLMSKHVVPHMRKAGRGSIVNSGSDCAHRGCANMIGYVAAKAAMPVMTSAMAVDLWASGIRVNCVSPGFINTNMAVAVLEHERGRVPTPADLDALQSPTSIAEAVMFLCSEPEAAEITGVTLPVSRLALASHP